MKKSTTFYFLSNPSAFWIMLLSCSIVFVIPSMGQRAWRVNQLSFAGADFMGLQTAIDSASNGDTLYVEPGWYGNISLTKSLYLYGVGFDIMSYDTATAFESGTSVGRLRFFAAGSGSTIEGFNFDDVQITETGGSSRVQVNDITIRRCRIGGYLWLYRYGTYNFPFSVQNWNIEQSLIGYLSIGDGSSSFVSNTKFSNCVIGGRPQGAGSPVSGAMSIHNSIAGVSNYSGIIFDRNVFYYCSFSPNGAVFSNNIIDYTVSGWNSSLTGNSFNNNVFVASQPAAAGTNTFGSTNIFGVPRADIFVPAVSADVVTNYRLKAGSPAANAAVDGGECGIFGGYFPMPVPPTPSNPRIYLVEHDGTSNPVTNQLRLRIKASSGEQ